MLFGERLIGRLVNFAGLVHAIGRGGLIGFGAVQSRLVKIGFGFGEVEKAIPVRNVLLGAGVPFHFGNGFSLAGVPKPGDGVQAGRCEAFAVAADRHGGHGATVLNLANELAIFDVPKAHGTVAAAGQDLRRGGWHGVQRRDRAGVPFEVFHRNQGGPGRVNEPEADHLIVSTGSDLPAVVQPRDRVDLRGCLRARDEVAPGNGPDSELSVTRAGAELDAVGRKLQRVDRAGVPAQCSYGFGRNGIPQSDVSVIAAGGEPMAVRADRQRFHDFSCDRGQFGVLRVFGPPPQLHFAESAGSKHGTVRVEGQGMYQVAMRDAGFVSALQHLGIRPAGHQLRRGEVVNENLIGPGAGGELAVRRQAHGVNRVQSSRQGLPFDGSDGAVRTFCSLVDPELDEAQLFRC